MILGTAREGRRSENAAKFMLQEAMKAGLKSEIIDVRDYRLEATDNTEREPQALRFAQRVLSADALIIVAPEYNRGYPGELKMMLDMIYRQYAGLPVAICGVSSGSFGGARMIQQLKLVCIALGMHPLEEAVYFSNVETLFSEDGRIAKESYYKRAQALIEELVLHAHALQSLRKGDSSRKTRRPKA